MADDDGHSLESKNGIHHSVPGGHSKVDREFGRQGWLLVFGLFIAFVLVPGVIYLNASGVVALPFRFSFLVLPLFPALLLAVLAVWVTTSN